MSYAIIRNAKHKMKNLKSVGKHNERKNKHYGNKEVDLEKSHLNFHLKEPIENGYEKEFYRIREENNLKGRLRLTGETQSNVVCEFLVTSDPQYFESIGEIETKRYFEEAYEFAKVKCGGDEHILSAFIHMDESTPHMHLTYIPVVEAVTKKGEAIKKINCSEFWKGFNSYGVLQDEFHEFVIEKGFDLERGEIGKEYLELDEFKIKTKMNELQEAKAEVERLENFDKSVELNPQKGKLVYSTQEVESLKDQNKALKVELNNKNKSISTLNTTVVKLESDVLKHQKSNQALRLPLKEMDDLQDEKEALNNYLAKRPKLSKAMESFKASVKRAYDLGNDLLFTKKKYVKNGVELKTCASKISMTIKKNIESDKSLLELPKLQSEIMIAENHLYALKSGSNDSKGIFNSGQRKEIANEIENEQIRLEQLTKSLETEFDIKPGEIGIKLQSITSDVKDFTVIKQETKKTIDLLKQSRAEIVNDYKYYKSFSNAQDESLRAISNRKDATLTLSPNEELELNTSIADRKWILERIELNQPIGSAYVTNCKNQWEIDDREAEIKSQNRANTKSITYVYDDLTR
jgi:hypothetical protein